MPLITPEIPDKTDGVSRLSAAELMGIRDAVLAAIDLSMLAATTGNAAVHYTDEGGRVVGRPVMPANNLVASDIIAGTSTGGLNWNAKAHADVGAATVCAVATNAVALNFANSLRCTTDMTDNVTTLTAANLPTFALGLWQIKGHASNAYTVTLPTGGTWASANGAASIHVPANSYIVASLCRFDSKTLIGWSTPYTVLA